MREKNKLKKKVKKVFVLWKKNLTFVAQEMTVEMGKTSRKEEQTEYTISTQL
jgi:hypothetical protein